MLSSGLVIKSCPTLVTLQSQESMETTMDCSLPGSSAHRILQARILEWVARSPKMLRDASISLNSNRNRKPIHLVLHLTSSK